MKTNSLPLIALVLAACGPNFPGNHPPCGASYVGSSLSSVTLAQDCPDAKRGSATDFAGACAQGFECTSLCRQTSMQLAFASTSDMAATIHIVAVRVIDPATNKVLDTLQARDPQQWSADKYVAWDQVVGSGVELKATYKLSAPNFASYASGRLAYGQTYRVEVDLTVDGVLRTMQVDAQREPEVAT